MKLEAVKAALEARGYTVTVFPTARAAADYLDTAIDGETVGIGGSMTVEEMGLFPRLAAHNEVIWHWHPRDGKTAEGELAAARTASVYLSSVNALSEEGEIVNIDGTGNRVAATLFGHRKVYFLVGCNKLAPTESEAISRARNVAAPKNAVRLGRPTPCTVQGRCMDCRSPARICRALTVLWEAPRGAEYEVVLIGEELGY